MKRKNHDEKPTLMERARKLVTGNGDEHEETPERRYKVGDVYLNDEQLKDLPHASDLDRASQFLDKAKAGGRMSPQVQLKALEFALKPDKAQLRSATLLEDRHIFYMATALTWEKIAANDPRPYMEIWAEYFMELRRSGGGPGGGYTLMAAMRQAGVDTEADAITKMGGRMF